jgi:thiamine-phosphate pyrophosphorylase
VKRSGDELLERRLFCYLVTDPRVETRDTLLDIVKAAISGGVTAVQLRAKGWTDRNTLEAAQALSGICRSHGVLFLVNDRVDIAMASGADGVHLGVEDLPVACARDLLGAEAVIGYSPEGEADLQAALQAGANYLGIGPVFGTQTKQDAGPAIGLSTLRATVDRVDVPCIGIGGIDHTNAPSVIETGATGVAVVSSILFADDPASAARQLVEVMQ